MKLSAVRPIAMVLSRELMITALLLLGVSFVVFIILFVSPGDSFSVLLEGQLSTAEVREGVREAMGVSRSWYLQYLSWLADMLTGNFGTSIRMGSRWSDAVGTENFAGRAHCHALRRRGIQYTLTTR